MRAIPAALLLVLAGCAATDGPSRVLEPMEGVTVYPDDRVLEVAAFVCLDEGWLEFVACSPGTKEHETLVVIETPPSSLHAALLMAGLNNGAPGNWEWRDEQLHLTPPTGDGVELFVRYEVDGRTVVHPISEWIVDAGGQQRFPEHPWVFGGSLLEGSTYVADMTGSIVGLATFGDEVIGFEEVLSHESEIQAPEWMVNTERIPPFETPVTLVFKGK